MAASENEIDAALLQPIADAAAERVGIAGGQVSIIRGDARTDLVFGTANAGLDIPMTVDTLIQIGSSTKILNAALVMTFVDEGKLVLDAPITDALPDVQLADPQALEQITLTRLLSMSSGLDNGPYTDHGAGDDTLARYVDSLAEVPQAFPPGKGWGYSNAGTSIAGFACERAGDATWDQLLRRRILEPAGLKHAATLAEELPFHRVSAGHTPATDDRPPGVIKPFYMQRSQGPAGSTLAMSAHDLATFGAMMMRRGKALNGERILSQDAVDAMTTPTTAVPTRILADAWGLGPYRMDWTTTIAWGHAGGNQSGTSYLVWFPERQAVLSIVVNTPAIGQRFVREMFAEFGPKLFDAELRDWRLADRAIDDLDFKPYVGRYIAWGTEYEVTAVGKSLHVKWTMSRPGHESVVVFDGAVQRLGKHRFMTTSMNGDPSEIAFFNASPDGRMQNLVAPTFPARRVG